MLEEEFDIPNETTEIEAVFEIVTGGADWGAITGDINEQTDLIDLIDVKLSALGGNLENEIAHLETQLSALGLTVEQDYETLDGKIEDINTVLNGFGDIVTHNTDEFATAEQGLLADTALQPNDDITELNNNAGFITLNQVPDINNGTLTLQKNGVTVQTFSANQSENATANLIIPTMASDIGALPDTTTIDDLTTTAQQNALNSGATTTNIGQITTNANNISDIQDLIPNAATENNQLADKDFVNSSISTNTANFIGTFNSVTALNAYAGTVTNNDYAFVVNSVITDNGSDWATFNDLDAYDKDLLTNFDYAWVVNGSNFDLYRFDILNQTWNLRVSDTPKASVTLNTAYNRYKATVSGSTVAWSFEYTLNNSSFTASQWASINSTATVNKIDQIDINTGFIQDIQATLSALGSAAYYDALDFATAAQGAKADTALQPADIVSSVDSSSTNSKAVGAKLFYDTCGDIETLINAL